MDTVRNKQARVQSIKIEETMAFIEQISRKNNVAIFELKDDQDNFMRATLSENTLASNVYEQDANNLYIRIC